MRLTSTKHKAARKGDLVRRVTDNATGIYLYTYRDYDRHMTTAQWPDGQNPLPTALIWVYCEEDKDWKGVKPC